MQIPMEGPDFRIKISGVGLRNLHFSQQPMWFLDWNLSIVDQHTIKGDCHLFPWPQSWDKLETPYIYNSGKDPHSYPTSVPRCLVDKRSWTHLPSSTLKSVVYKPERSLIRILHCLNPSVAPLCPQEKGQQRNFRLLLSTYCSHCPLGSS